MVAIAQFTRPRTPEPGAPPFVYLDHPATTPADQRVVDAMLPWMGARAGNCGQLLHERGRAALAAVEDARSRVLRSLGVSRGAGRVVLTSGATEANNLALLGFGAGLAAGSRVVVGATEHASVLAAAGVLVARGIDVRYVGVDADGVLDLGELERALDGRAALVSVQAVNNETGVVQPVAAIAQLARRAGARMHVDAAQAWGKLPIAPGRDGVDLVTLSGHKASGPAGVGALVAVDSRVLARIVPLVHGGGQEGGVRSGTVNVAGAVGLGVAADIVRLETDGRVARARSLQGVLERELRVMLRGSTINGFGVARSPYITSVELPGIEARAVLERLPRLAASTTSACTGGGPSHVLRAMGRTDVQAAGTIRLGIGRETTAVELQSAVRMIAGAVRAG